jgi:hypothetical protein
MPIMRKGYVHNIFPLKNDAGLSEVLPGKVSFQQAIQTYESRKFDVVRSAVSYYSAGYNLYGDDDEKVAYAKGKKRRAGNS